jgi:uncharacterized membrane protein YkvA (DUF1232 family)
MSESRIYNRVLNRAKSAVRDNGRLREVLIEVGEKLVKVGDKTGESESFVKLIKMLIRMLSNHISGAYRSFSPLTLVMTVFSLIYFITPLDLIPDFIPALGFTDDLAVIVMVMRRFTEDLDRYREWERSHLSQ